MEKNKIIKFCLFKYVACGIILIFSQSSSAAIIPIDLNDFFADPTVTVSVDGSSATLSEDPVFSQALLVNDPGLGDPEVIIAGIGTSLLFDFSFSEPLGNNDVFTAFVLDGSTGTSFGPGFEFSTMNSGSGSVAFDLTSLVGQTVGLQFALSGGIDDTLLTSTVDVFDVRLVTADLVVPEPPVLLLFGVGLLFLMARSGSHAVRHS